jgi:hypothetical protein
MIDAIIGTIGYIAVIVAILLIIAIGFSLYDIEPVAGQDKVRVNKTICLTVDAYDRTYDKKGDCYIPLTKDNVDQFCEISKGVEEGWCDQEVITSLMYERWNSSAGMYDDYPKFNESNTINFCMILKAYNQTDRAPDCAKH